MYSPRKCLKIAHAIFYSVILVHCKCVQQITGTSPESSGCLRELSTDERLTLSPACDFESCHIRRRPTCAPDFVFSSPRSNDSLVRAFLFKEPGESRPFPSLNTTKPRTLIKLSQMKRKHVRMCCSLNAIRQDRFAYAPHHCNVRQTPALLKHLIYIRSYFYNQSTSGQSEAPVKQPSEGNDVCTSKLHYIMSHLNICVCIHIDKSIGSLLMNKFDYFSNFLEYKY